MCLDAYRISSPALSTRNKITLKAKMQCFITVTDPVRTRNTNIETQLEALPARNSYLDLFLSLVISSSYYRPFNERVCPDQASFLYEREWSSVVLHIFSSSYRTGVFTKFSFPFGGFSKKVTLPLTWYSSYQMLCPRRPHISSGPIITSKVAHLFAGHLNSAFFF